MVRVATRFYPALGAPLAFIAALGGAGVAPAQDKTTQTITELGRLRLSCGDFARNRDNSWSPTHSVVVGVMAVSPTSSFRPGDSVAGADLGAILDQECKDQTAQFAPNPSATPSR